jgi:hypothetical protein
MNINDSFFNPNRLVFQQKAPTPEPSAGGKAEYLDLYDRTDLLDEMEATLGEMKDVDPKLRAELDEAQRLNTESKDEKVASDAAQKLYAKLGVQEAPVRGEIAEARKPKAGKVSGTRAHGKAFAAKHAKPQISETGGEEPDPFYDPWLSPEENAERKRIREQHDKG